MTQTIALSDDTYRRLLQRVQSFDDTAEDVIRRLLAQEARDSAQLVPIQTESTDRERAAPGSILPERAYWHPILTVLAEHGGSAHANDVIEAVGKLMEGDLLPRDFEELQIGEVRWRNRVRFARLRMKERGLLSDQSPRGIWEMTARGQAFLNGDTQL